MKHVSYQYTHLRYVVQRQNKIKSEIAKISVLILFGYVNA